MLDPKTPEGTPQPDPRTEQLEALQTQLAEALSAANTQQDFMDKLQLNNAALLEEKKAETDKVETERREKLEADGKHSEILAEERARWDEERTSRTKEVTRLSNQMNGMTGDAVLKATLKNAGVSEDMAYMAESYFRNNWEFDEKGSVQHNGMALADSIKEWATSDAGKPFIVSTNSGSGVKPPTPTDLTGSVADMSFEQKLEHLNSGGKIN